MPNHNDDDEVLLRGGLVEVRVPRDQAEALLGGPAGLDRHLADQHLTRTQTASDAAPDAPDAAGGIRKQRREDTHRRLLDAGTAILLDCPVDDMLRRVSIEAITVRAQRSRKVFYDHFDDLEQYRAELFSQIMEPENWPSSRGVHEVVVTALQDARRRLGRVPTFRECTLIGIETLHQFGRDMADYLVLGFALMGAKEPNARTLLKRILETAIDTYVAQLDVFLLAYGRRPKPPWTTSSIAAWLYGSGRGMLQQWITAPKYAPADFQTDPDTGQTYSMYTWGVTELIDAMTEDDPDAIPNPDLFYGPGPWPEATNAA